MAGGESCAPPQRVEEVVREALRWGSGGTWRMHACPSFISERQQSPQKPQKLRNLQYLKKNLHYFSILNVN